MEEYVLEVTACHQLLENSDLSKSLDGMVTGYGAYLINSNSISKLVQRKKDYDKKIIFKYID